MNEIGFSVNFRSVVERALDAVGNVLDIPSDIVLFYDKLFDIIEYEVFENECGAYSAVYLA